MKIRTKKFCNFHFLIILFVIISCKEEEIIAPLPDQEAVKSLEFVKGNSIEDLETVSIYQGSVDIYLNVPLDSLVGNDTSSHKYKILLDEVKLRTGDQEIATEKSTNLNGITAKLPKLIPSTLYSLDINFSLLNEANESVSFSESIDFTTYELHKHYNEGQINAILRNENKLKAYDLLMLETSLSQGKIYNDQNIEFKSELKVEIFKGNQSVKINQVSEGNKVYLFKDITYLFDSGNYTYRAQEIFYEKISGEWKQTETINKVEVFEILSAQDSYLEKQSPLSGETIDKNETFNFFLKEIESISDNFLKVKIVLDSIVLEKQSGGTYDVNIYNEDQFSRIVPSDVLNSNESTTLKYYLKFSLSNDTLDFVSPKIIEEGTSDFTTSDKIGTPVKPSDFSASYPIAKQRNFFVDEFGKGAFQLQSKLGFEEYFKESIDYKMFFIESNDTMSVDAVFNNQDLTLKFDLPSNLKVNTIYNYQIYDKTNLQLMFSDHFKTSKYRTLTDKFVNMIVASGSSYKDEDGTYRLRMQLISDESFDFAEVDFDMGENNGLISVIGNLSNTDWYTNNFYQNLYTNLDKLPFEISWRDELEINKVPNNAFEGINNGIYLSDQEIESGIIEENDNYNKRAIFYCFYESVFRRDYRELKSLASDYNGEQNEYVDLIVESDFVPLINGNYPVEIKYTIPVYEEVSYNETWNFLNN